MFGYKLYSFFNLSARWEWVVNDTPQPLYSRKIDRVPIVQGAGWAPGPVGTGAHSLALTGFRSPDRQARSGSLHRLSYAGQHTQARSGSLHRLSYAGQHTHMKEQVTCSTENT